MQDASNRFSAASILQLQTLRHPDPSYSKETFLTSAMKIRMLISGVLFALLPPVNQLPADAQEPMQGQMQDQGPRQSLQDIEDHGIRGTVTAVSGDTLTVKTEQGDVYKVETGPNTRIRKFHDPIKISDLHPGDMVAAIGDKDEKAKNVGALFVLVFDKQQYDRAKADFGKTWTTGVVQSLEDVKITLKRPDGVVQTITVDENTSFRKRRDSITLLDIRTGDTVNARGALQGGVFLATTVNVGGPGDRHGPGNSSPQPPPNQ